LVVEAIRTAAAVLPAQPAALVAGCGDERRPRILFVDDEPQVVSELRRMLRPQNPRWCLRYVTSAAEALEQLAVEPVDVLITDTRMPGMDGAALLDTVRQHHPAVVRLALSGHADHESLVRTSGLTQQFVAKPCDHDLLVRALESALGTKDLVQSDRLRALIGSQDNLPKPPAVYHQLVELTKNPDTTMGDVARLIETDVAATTEALKLVNSSFFGLPRRITTVERAITALGFDVVKALVLAGHVFRGSTALPADLDTTALAERGLLASMTIRRFGTTEGWDPATVSWLGLAALLHDVGLLVLAAADHEAWAAYRDAPRTISARERELEAFGCTIARASAYLLGLWGFHANTVAALVEQPIDVFDPVSRYAASPAGLAVAFAHGGQSMFVDLLSPVPTEAPRAVYLTATRLAAWLPLLG